MASGLVGVGPVLLVTAIAVAVAGVIGALLAAPAARRSTGSTADVRVTRLAGLPLFAGVPAATLEAIAVKLAPVTVAAGEVVIRQGDPADRFYLIEEGSFEVTQARAEAGTAGAAATGAEAGPRRRARGAADGGGGARRRRGRAPPDDGPR